MADAPRYRDLTPAERLAAYNDQAEAAAVHEQQFCLRPFNPRRRLDREAWQHMLRCQREAAFIERVARSCGDPWAGGKPAPKARKAAAQPDRFTMRRSAHGGWYVFDGEAPSGDDRLVGLFANSGDARTWIADTLAGRGSEVLFKRVRR